MSQLINGGEAVKHIVAHDLTRSMQDERKQLSTDRPVKQLLYFLHHNCFSQPLFRLKYVNCIRQSPTNDLATEDEEQTLKRFLYDSFPKVYLENFVSSLYGYHLRKDAEERCNIYINAEHIGRSTNQVTHEQVPHLLSVTTVILHELGNYLVSMTGGDNAHSHTNLDLGNSYPKKMEVKVDITWRVSYSVDCQCLSVLKVVIGSL